MFKKILSILAVCSVVFVITACGADNSTPMDAAQTLMKSVVEGDSELNAKVNHSDEFSFPADYMMEVANDDHLVGKDIKDFTFEEDKDNQNNVIVKWKDEEGEDRDWVLEFNQEKDGYFFTDLR